MGDSVSYIIETFFFLNGVLDALLPSGIENQALEPVCLKSY